MLTLDIWLWVKKGYPKKNYVGKRKNRPKPVVFDGFWRFFFLTPSHISICRMVLTFNMPLASLIWIHDSCLILSLMFKEHKKLLEMDDSQYQAAFSAG